MLFPGSRSHLHGCFLQIRTLQCWGEAFSEGVFCSQISLGLPISGLCDHTGPIWIIQDNLPILRSLTTSAKPHSPPKELQVLRSLMWTFWGALLSLPQGNTNIISPTSLRAHSQWTLATRFIERNSDVHVPKPCVAQRHLICELIWTLKLPIHRP